jgi:hypothetical protein
MQGISKTDRDLWDAGDVTGHLVPPDSVFAFLAEHCRELFPDSFTADPFPSRTGRPSLPTDLFGAVLVLKELYDLSDTQTADALKFDIRWKVACGRSLLQVSFDPSALVYWRRRIAASERPDRVFDAVAEVIAQTGILRGRRKRCVDSTVFDDAVATMDTVCQLVAAMRKVARVVPGAGEVIAAVCGLDYSRPGKPDIDWDDPQAKDQLVSDLVNDALAVLAVLAGPDAPERDAAEADALGLLVLVAGQDVEPAQGSDGTDGRWRIARRVAPDRVISTVSRGSAADLAGGGCPRRCSSTLAFPALYRVLSVRADHSSYWAAAASRRLVSGASAAASDLAFSARSWSWSASASAACCHASASAWEIRRSRQLVSGGAAACPRSASNMRASSSPRLIARSSASSSAISRARKVS